MTIKPDEMIPGKLYSFQNMLYLDINPLIGTFIKTLPKPDYTQYEILVDARIRTVDLFMYEITEL